MKTKLYLLLFCVVALYAFSGCGDDDNNKSPYSQKIIGTWVSVETDGETVPTEETFINTFGSGSKEVYASVYKDLKEWVIEPECLYQLDDDIMYEKWTAEDGTLSESKTRISIEDNVMTCNVLQLIKNGVIQEDGESTYVLKKVTSDYSEEFVGLWKGKETTPGVTKSEVYFRFLEDGTYIYYYYIKSSDSYGVDDSGKYYLYGDFFASHWDDEVMGKGFECWNFSIDGNTMNWKALKSDGKEVFFTLNRASIAPVIK